LAAFNSLALLLVFLLAQAAFTSLGSPARRTFVSRILPREQVGAGVALSHLSFQASMLAGPVLAGLIIARWGLAACYAAEALAFCAALYGVAGLPALRPPGTKGKAGIRGIGDGMRFIAGRPALSGSFLSDLAATLLAMPVALFPAINEARFGGSPETLGLFLAAIAVGGVCATAASGLITGSARPGRVQLAAAGTWGAALAVTGLVHGLWPTLVFLALAGAGDTVAVISRGTLLQLAAPDAYRGRISAVEQVVGVGGPQLGNFRAGLVAGLATPEVALASGGILCVLAVGGIVARNSALRDFTIRDGAPQD
ncbi:MAG: MFS transporter, partial [Actinomycetales bacterium]